ncbi:MAG: 8-oxoguanine DNA glycosylase, partial [Armatimonadetes bacterium]|nr:8-oxoguanine DNA glycosylase [Armatimonadota bacterium]
AIAALPGLRILRQDPWDCLLSYLCSPWNNIPKIELSTERIARRWGTVREFERAEGHVEVACLPSPETLAQVAPEELRACALGYRCPYLSATAVRVARGEISPMALRRAPYEEALAVLLRLPGVGRKVADCVLLFSLDKYEAFPVDVWVRRILHERYGTELTAWLPDLAARRERPLSPMEHRALVRFAWQRWGALAGYAQEYLFFARRRGLL